MLKLRLSCLLTAPILMTLPAFIAENLIYGIASVDTFYLFVGIQVLIQSIPRYKKLCYAGWLLIPYDFWFGFCWILAHLIANALTTRQTHQYHIGFILAGIALPFISSNQVFIIQCMIYCFSLFLLVVDATRRYPQISLIGFVIPWMPFHLGTTDYQPSDIFHQIEKTFKPSKSIKHTLSPLKFNHWSSVSKDPIMVASGVPDSLLIPLAKNSLIKNQRGEIRFSDHFRKIQPVLVQHYPLYFIFRDVQTDLFLGFHSLTDFLTIIDSTLPRLENESSTPLAAVLFSQVFNSYNVLANYWSEDLNPKYDLAHKISEKNVNLVLAHKVFDNSIWQQFSENPKFKAIIQTPKFYIDGANWMIKKGYLEIAHSLVFQLEQMPKQKHESLLLRVKLAEAKADYWTALYYAQEHKSIFDNSIIDAELQRLLKICEQEFVNYGQDFPYSLLSELSQTLYNNSGRKRTDLLMDSLRYQRKLLPKQFNDLSSCMSCAEKQMNEKRRIEALKHLMQNPVEPEKGRQSLSKTLKEPDSSAAHKHPSNEHQKE